MNPHAGNVHHVTDADRGQTLAAFLRGRLGGSSWSRVQKLVRSRHVLIHGNVCTDAARRLKPGEVVKLLDVAAPPPPRADDIRIVHLDDDVVVVDKPSGITTTRHHEELSWPARRRQAQPTLEEMVPNAIAMHLAAAGGRRRRIPPVRAVHRIDRETSGLVVFARNVPAGRILAEQFRLHTTHRRYLALVPGSVRAGTIQSHLVRDRGDGRRGSADDEEGKIAITHVAPLEQFGTSHTLVECRLETGRTHQIRIHMAESGHPICGERVYAAPRKGARADDLRVPRVMLHAAELGFVHPVTGADLRFASPLPADMRKVISGLRRQADQPDSSRDRRRDRGRGPQREHHEDEAREE
jgi:23S rRNA pseudouridine1911/1915/1917 synthase